MPEAQQKIEVHIGAGANTLPVKRAQEGMRNGLLRVIAVDPLYLPANKDEPDAKAAKWKAERAGIVLHGAFGDETGLEADATDSIHIINVFNSDDFDPDNANRVICEAMRIVRPNGEIFIGADNMPDRFPLRKLKHITDVWHVHMEILLQQKKRFAYTQKDRQEYESVVGSTTLSAWPPDDESYLVRLTPTQETLEMKRIFFAN